MKFSYLVKTCKNAKCGRYEIHRVVEGNQGKVHVKCAACNTITSYPTDTKIIRRKRHENR